MGRHVLGSLDLISLPRRRETAREFGQQARKGGAAMMVKVPGIDGQDVYVNSNAVCGVVPVTDANGRPMLGCCGVVCSGVGVITVKLSAAAMVRELEQPGPSLRLNAGGQLE